MMGSIPTDSHGMPPDSHGIQREAIAVVGMGCRLPGHVSSPPDLWKLLIENRSGHCQVPTSRYNKDGFYHPDAERPGSINSTGGYFLNEDIRSFDNAFFGINNLEATHMDAQQRKLLEVVYESFESGGVPLSKVHGSRTGVYIGNFTNDYMIMQYKDPEYFSRYSATGSGPTVLSNRITHCFDLRGPSVVLDTACSSSLYALHFACLALDAHDCDAAVVASANLIQSAEQQLIAVKAGILSPDSTCHTFDESANGYGRADGMSSLYLKRLRDAQRDGDPIRCVIRGTAVNGNGQTPGIVQPSIDGQEAVIRAAYRRARLPTDETDYVETHGTGTKVGDPIELQGISRVFHHKTGMPTPVGGIKPNLGHSEGASGISSIIKLALAFEHGQIPATIGVNRINPSIKLDEWGLDIVRENRPWPTSQVARASVNSFGFGGANAHAILEAPPAPRHNWFDATANGRLARSDTPTNETTGSALALLTFSARTEHSLSLMVKNVAEYVSRPDDDTSFGDLACTLNKHRSRLASRGFAIVNPRTLAQDLNPERLVKGSSRGEALPFAFVFTGQGAQWPGMGNELLSHYSRFRESIKYLDACLASLDPQDRPSWTLEGILLATSEESDINLAEKSQPVCTAVQLALVDLLIEWDIVPKVVLGHSSGEIAAAYAAGCLSAYQAIMAAYFRGRTVSLRAREGAMIAVGLGKEAAQAVIDQHGLASQVSLACDNSPESTTLSGDADAVDKLLESLQEDKVFARKLRTDGKAYHSRHTKEIGHLYQDLLDTVWHNADHERRPCSKKNALGRRRSVDSRIRLISSVTGGELDTNEMSETDYWRANLESPVRFRDAVEGVFGLGQHHLMEIGPHSALELPIKQVAAAQNRAPGYYAYDSALVRGRSAVVTLLWLVGSLFLHEHDDLPLPETFPDNLAAEARHGRILTSLPRYPWDYTAPQLWTEPRAVTEFRNRRFPRHDLLGSQVTGASKRTTTWRNIVDVNEIPWLKDHCLGPSIVFPAAAYLAMGAEAMCQVNGIRLRDCPGVELRQFNFLKAMDFHSEQRPRREVITEMRKAPVTSVLDSNTWWELSVTSISGEGNATVHASGLACLAEKPQALPRRINLIRSDMEKQATRIWYDKFTREGLNWGPEFAVMEDIYCDRARQANVSLATTCLIRGESTGIDKDDRQYIVHPISIDSMLQTAFVATTGGWVRNLRATVPVKMDKISFSSPALLDMDLDKAWAVDTMSNRVGFGTVNIDAELYNASGDTLIRIEGARCIAYQGNTQQETPEQRNPMCRVAWKPDIALMGAGPNAGLTKYTSWFVANFNKLPYSHTMVTEPLIRLAAVLDLYAHKNPLARILLLINEARGSETDKCSQLLLSVLNAGAPQRRFETFTQATLTDGELRGHEISSAEQDPEVAANVISKDNKFDLVINLKDSLEDVQEWMSPSSWLLTRKKSGEGAFATSARVETITEVGHQSVSITVFREKNGQKGQVQEEEKKKETKKKREVVMVNRTGRPTTLDIAIHKAMESTFARKVPMIGIAEVDDSTIPPRSVVISTIELEEPLLSIVNEEQMRQVKTLTDRASLILWVCHADLMAGANPEFAPVLGLSRAVMLEQPSLRFSVFDLDNIEADVDVTADNACKIVDQLMNEADPELELSQKERVLHSVRWEPLDSFNSQFRLKQDEGLLEVPIASAGRCKLHISHPGQMDTIHFVSEEQQIAKSLPPSHVDVEIKSVGINAKDLYVLSAKVDTHNVSCSCECAGVVIRVGSEVKDLAPGDRVVAMAPGHFATHEQLPRWAVCKLQENEDFTTTSTIPIVFSTAIYGLKYRADLQPGESLLIHSAAGGVGLAAIQLAQHIGAEIFATVGNDSKKKFLIDSFGLEPARIFSSRDASFLPAIMEATDGQGVDVVLNSLTGELLRSSFEACADFGRFVEIGKRDILDDGLLNMASFGKNVSLMAFDLSNLFYSKKPGHHRLWQKLLEESMTLIRGGIAKPCMPVETFRASEITQAFRHFSLGTRIGKVTVSFEDGADRIRVKPRRHETRFSPNKSYLMIGCLGGLGRSISRWMISLGAMSLVFLSRSGLKRPEAKTLVDDLAGRGAWIEVVQGDVANYDDVDRAIQQAPLPIGGVIHAAMGLSEALWSSMQHSSWHASIAPKVRGSWNLHHALEKDGRDVQLDFFILTSSISGTVGTATESNYCAANSFLDAFARYRNRLGRPAMSIGYGMIAEVGYLHEHPEIEALLQRKGIQSINEDELLQILDLAIAHQSPTTWSPHYDQLVGSHVLTGIEFARLKEQRDRGFEGGNHVLADPRASLFAAAYERSTRTSRHGAMAAGGHGFPPEVAKALAAGGSDMSVFDAVQAIVAHKIANLILLPVEQLQPEQKLGEFGIDSMLASEFRTSIFHALQVDVPFMTLLDKQISVRSLTEMIMKGLEEKEKE